MKAIEIRIAYLMVKYTSSGLAGRVRIVTLTSDKKEPDSSLQFVWFSCSVLLMKTDESETWTDYIVWSKPNV